ncbi:MAG: hypothetical protein ACLRSW_12005 [Christensenellaceae bacterium]
MEENGMLQLKEKYDIIIARGRSGLNAALFLPRDKDILLISKESPKHSDSYLAQGGICVLKWDGDHDIFSRTRCGRGITKITATRSSACCVPRAKRSPTFCAPGAFFDG